MILVRFAISLFALSLLGLALSLTITQSEADPAALAMVTLR
jgi:hypothetical protein